MIDDGFLFADFHYSVFRKNVCFPCYFAFVDAVVAVTANAGVVIVVVVVVVAVVVAAVVVFDVVLAVDDDDDDDHE